MLPEACGHCTSSAYCEDCSFGSYWAFSNPYWERVCEIAEEQREKGLSKYGFGLEDNKSDMAARIRHLEEELIDGLMYCEWIKEKLEGID